MAEEKVYLVGDYGTEHYSVASVHKTYAGALKAFQKHRERLIRIAKTNLENIKRDKRFGRNWIKMYKTMLRKLNERNPEKIDNYPHDTPCINKWILED